MDIAELIRMNSPLYLDFDGVLIDSLNLYLDLFKRVCKEHNKFLPVHDAAGFRDWYHPNWERNFYELGFTDEQYHEICAEYPSTLDYGQAPLFDGIGEMITELHERHPLVVVSTAPTANIEARLEQAGLRQSFTAITGSDDGSTHKTERLLRLKQEYGRGIMVGDTDHDIEAGRDAGMLTMGVTYGWLSEARVRESGPDYVVHSSEDLKDALEGALRGA